MFQIFETANNLVLRYFFYLIAAGDAGTTSHDAEVHSIGNRIYFYGRDDPAGGSYGLLHSQPDFVGATPYSQLTMDVQDERARVTNGLSTILVDNPKLYALSGQADDHDLYLGMNRVVGTSARRGTGLCKVTLQFFPA